jgi:hypothetical protein
LGRLADERPSYDVLDVISKEGGEVGQRAAEEFLGRTAGAERAQPSRGGQDLRVAAHRAP